MDKRGFSNSMYVAELRYIQSIHEARDLQNPDRLVGQLLPLLRRWRCKWISRGEMAVLRADPFYYYLLARTRYYDKVVLAAIARNVRCIVNVGCGTDTRAYRFQNEMKEKDVQVIECDELEAISIKQNVATCLGVNTQVSYLSIDLNDGAWPNFESWLARTDPASTLVVMEGVSPYIDRKAFVQFLRMLGRTLQKGSQVSYDFKLQGVCDGFGRVGRVQEPFRLSADTNEIAAFHEECGLKIDHFERSEELSARLLPNLNRSHHALFIEDALIRLQVAG